jgi:hypothetical protein
MRDVYKEASTVRIWLGKEGKSTQHCFETFEIASRRVADPEGVPDNVYDMYQIMETCLDSSHRPWWRRLWVVQEATLARRPVAHCGPLHLDFRSLLHWMHAFVGFQIQESLSAGRRSALVIPGTIGTGAIAHDLAKILPMLIFVVLFSGMKDLSSEESDAKAVIRQFTKMKDSLTTLRHDRIYGLLGLCPRSLGIPIRYRPGGTCV